MPGPELDPGKVKKPIQLLAVMIAGLVLLVGGFLTGAAKIERPPWAPAVLVIAAVVSVPLFVGVVVLMWTRFRVHLQDDHYYAEWLKRQEKTFRGFRAENVSTRSLAQVDPTATALQGEPRRLRRYEETQGIFLVHRWRASHTRGQIADIVIEPVQHREGPLSAGLVESVTYYLGPRFFGGKSVIKKDALDNFRLEVSAYGPLLCLAEVRLKGRKEPVVLERYVDFDADVQQQA
jgi:prokaryotic YEATS domain